MGICALCLTATDLRRSHLLPRAICVDLRTPALRDPNPILASSEEVGPRQDQATGYVLCENCEHRLNVLGEKWVLENGYRLKGPSPLYNALRSADPEPDFPSRTVYSALKLSGIDPEQLGHFGTSVFWRSSLAAWRMGSEIRQFIELGPYAEPLRRYVAGETSFPSDVVLWVAVHRLEEPPPVMEFPAGEAIVERGRRFYRYTFDIPGLSFMLHCGEEVPDAVRELCLMRSPRRLLFFTRLDHITSKNFRQKLATASTSRALDRLLRDIRGFS